MESSFSWWGLLNLIFSGPGATIVLVLAALFVFACVLIFRERLKGLSVGFKDYKFTFEGKEPLSIAAPISAGASSDNPDSPGAIAKVEEDKRERSPGLEAVIGLRKVIDANDRPGIEAAFKIIKGNPPWKMDDEELEAWEQSSLLQAGFVDALQSLLKFEKDNPRNYHAVRFIAQYYLRIKAIDLAREFAEKAIARAKNSDDFESAVDIMAAVYKEEGGPESAIKYLASKLNDVNDDKSKARLYSAMAEWERELEKVNLAIPYFEKALNADVHYDSANFELAYIASTSEFTRLISLRHYNIYLQKRNGNTVATNNMGVLYGELGLPISKVRYWRSAQKNDDGYATGNLAVALIDAGFIDEARKEIDSAPEKIKSHVRIIFAQGHLKAEQERDANKYKQLNEKAEMIWRELRLHDVAVDGKSADYIGEWKDKSGANMSIEPHERGFRIIIGDGSHGISATNSEIVGFFGCRAHREPKAKGSYSVLGSLFASASGTLLMAMKRDAISAVFDDGEEVRTFAFSRGG